MTILNKRIFGSQKYLVDEGVYFVGGKEVARSENGYETAIIIDCDEQNKKDD